MVTLEKIDIHIEMVKEHVKKQYNDVEETKLIFDKPYKGLEKISETEFKLHIFEADFIIPFGTLFIARAYEKDIEITHASYHTDSYQSNIPIVKTTTNECIIQRTFKVSHEGYIHIKTSESMGAEPKFTITNVLKIGKPMKNHINMWTASSSGNTTMSSDVFHFNNDL